MDHLASHKQAFFRACGYTPYEQQLTFHQSAARFRVVAAGARAGKSMSAGAEAAFLFWYKPDIRIWVCSSQYELADKEFDWALEFLGRITYQNRKIIDYCRLNSASKGSRIIRAPWGSFIRTKSTEKSATLLGEELDCLVLGEASQVSRAPYERMLRERLGPRHGIVIAISTPNSDSGLFADFFERGQDKTFPDWESWQFPTIANPYFPKDEYEIARIELDEQIFQEQYEGKFVSRRGKVFNLSPENIFGDEDYRGCDWENLPVLIGVRPAQHNPYVVVWIKYRTSDNTYFVFDEYYGEHINARDAAKEIKTRHVGQRIIGRFGDMRDIVGAEELRNVGIIITSCDDGILPKQQSEIRRVQLIQNLLKLGVQGARLRIHTRCKRLIKDFERCTWQDSKNDKDRLEPELPLDRWMSGIKAISFPIVFLERARGINVYKDQ